MNYSDNLPCVQGREGQVGLVGQGCDGGCELTRRLDEGHTSDGEGDERAGGSLAWQQ